MRYELDNKIKERIWNLLKDFDANESMDEFEFIWDEMNDLYGKEIQDIEENMDDEKYDLERRVEDLNEELEELQKRDFIDFKIKNLYQQELFNFFKENIDKLTLEKLQSII